MIYLDHQATTPLAPEAKAAMLPWLDHPGNPHAPHRLGREAAAVVEAARAQVLDALGLAGGRLIFTGSATEALNLAIKGVAATGPRRRIVTIATEHAAVLDTARSLGGFELVELPVDAAGLVDLDAARDAIDADTALVAAMGVNNEIGVMHPLPALAGMARAVGARFLCDAVQAFARVDLAAAAPDLVAISAHKLYGPKGIGALWVRDGVTLGTLIHGGGQEGGLRSGTLSPMLCAGFGAAARVARASAVDDAAHVEALWALARAALPDWQVNGAERPRWRGNLNLRLPGLDAGRLISETRGVAFSAGSACASGSGRPSHVLRAIGLSDADARSSIRLGFGRTTTVDEIDRATALIADGAARQRTWAA